MTNSRVARGRRTQELVADWFRRHGWPDAESRAASLPGIDVMKMPGLCPEVKATPGDITGALKQAHRNRGDGLPFVVWRANGYGEERIEQWAVIFRLDDATALLKAAGYGDTDLEGTA
jgi:hypothetical protein